MLAISSLGRSDFAVLPSVVLLGARKGSGVSSDSIVTSPSGSVETFSHGAGLRGVVSLGVARAGSLGVFAAGSLADGIAGGSLEVPRIGSLGFASSPANGFAALEWSVSPEIVPDFAMTEPGASRLGASGSFVSVVVSGALWEASVGAATDMGLPSRSSLRSREVFTRGGSLRGWRSLVFRGLLRFLLSSRNE